jgi:PAS domain S-box-containing protein
MGNNLDNTSRFTEIKFLVFITLLISILLVLGGLTFYNYDSKQIKDKEFLQLKTISDLKADFIVQWLKERMSDGKHFSGSSLYVKAIEKWETNHDTSLGKDIKKRNIMIKELRGFESIFVITPDGQICLDTESHLIKPDKVIFKYIDSAFLYKKIYFTDFYYNTNEKHIELGIISPVINSSNKVIATIVFMVDPNAYFFPSIQKWPTPSKTSEIVLLHKIEDSILIFNEMRHSKNTVFNLRYQISDTTLPIVNAPPGYFGIFEGKDYRNMDVLADIRPIPGTHWIMIAKVDKAEVLSELSFRAIVIAILIFVLILLLGLISGWYYLIQRSKLYKTLFNNAKQIQKMEEEYRITLYSVGDGVISIDTKGFIKQMNREAERLTGWKESDAKGKPLEEVFRIEYENIITNKDLASKKLIEDNRREGSYKNSILLSKNGENIPIDGNSSFIKNDKDEVQGIVIIFKDQTKEREAQKALAFSESRLTRAEYISKSGNWELHLKTGLLYASSGAKKIYEKEEDLWDLLSIQKQPLPEYREKLDYALKNLIEKGEPYDIEFKIRKEVSGEIIDIHSVATYDKKNRIVFGVIRDITESKRNKDLLHEKDIIFQSLLEFSPIYIFFKDHNIRATYLSKNYEKMLGLPLSEILGKTMDDLFPSDLAKNN